MAKIKGILQATGSIKGVSFYTRMGSDEVIMRTKGGASKEKIKKSPKFEKLRQCQKEWSGCTKLASGIRLALGELPRLADYSVSGTLNGIAKTIQKTDTEQPVGQRHVLLSTQRDILTGFTMNRKYTFDSVLRATPIGVIDRENLCARVTIPRINTDIHLVNFPKLPFFRIIVTLGTLSDMVYDPDKRDYVPADSSYHAGGYTLKSEWFPTQGVIEEQSFNPMMENSNPGDLSDATTMILGIGVEFGTAGYDGKPVEVKYAGCGKVLGVK
ncbi:hypothetical protein [Parabacteroides sp. FAFU027]|uniref:hypothetical protein n=1 Tax=Parabacteroides sp. FAFU027 TaxID=2922715 RepID=UPI001FAF2713|nr:hypothetical protein [Parabacteroides sp. FAFU027]